MEAASTTSSAASSVDGRTSSVGGNDYLNRGMFSSQQESLLMGSGSGSGGGVFSMGNGFNNDAALSGGNGSSLGTSFDLSDFPSLGGGAGTSSGNGIAAALREQQQLLAHQQQLLQGGSGGNIGTGSKSNSNLYMLAMTGSNGNNFQMANEDFPALGGGRTQSNGAGVTNGSNMNVSSLMSNNISMQPGSSILENGLYGTGLDNGVSQLEGGAGLLGSAGLGGLSGLRSTGTVLPPVVSGSASAGAIGSSSAVTNSAAAGNALSGDYGLLGLLSVIRMTDADRNALALGSDLQLLGLNLGTTEQIFSTFASPWSEGNVSKEPHYQLPTCYYMQPPALKTGHLSKFQLETLFYIFYALPKDVLQAYAAQELYSREWRYHGELKLWFKRAGPTDGLTNALSGTPQYLYFDLNSWERRIFNGSMNPNIITNSFLPEDEVRVKFPSS